MFYWLGGLELMPAWSQTRWGQTLHDCRSSYMRVNLLHFCVPSPRSQKGRSPNHTLYLIGYVTDWTKWKVSLVFCWLVGVVKIRLSASFRLAVASGLSSASQTLLLRFQPRYPAYTLAPTHTQAYTQTYRWTTPPHPLLLSNRRNGSLVAVFM